MTDTVKKASLRKTTLTRSSVSTELRLVTDTDRHRVIASTALAYVIVYQWLICIYLLTYILTQ